MTRTKHHFAGLFAAIVTAWATFTLMTEWATAQKPAKINVPENVVFEPNIEYSNPDGQHLQLDMARPKTGDGPFPAIACIHGGGFRAGSRQGYDSLCVRLAERGYVAVTLSYRLAPKYQFPAAIHDVKAAIRWLRANAKLWH
jgi:acetyl esterase/lipase